MSLRHSSTCAGTSIRGFRFVAATSAVAVMLCACAGANRSAYRSPPDPNVQDVLSDTAQRRQVTPAAPLDFCTLHMEKFMVLVPLA